MSEIEIKQMQEKINAGILLARKRLIEKTKKEDGELVVVRDGKVVRIKAKDLKYFCLIEKYILGHTVGDFLYRNQSY